MLTLVLDTSTHLCLIGLVREGSLIAESIFPHDNRLSKLLLPSIRSFLHSQGLTLADLTQIAIGIGPGSYTGTRLGAAVAKTLGFALDIPLVPFHSPCAFIPQQAQTFTTKIGPTCQKSPDCAFLIPTKPGPYFVLTASFDVEKGIVERETLLMPAEELETHLESIPILIHSSSPPFVSPLKEKMLLAPDLNLSLLAITLSSIPSVPADTVELAYFHTPFFERS